MGEGGDPLPKLVVDRALGLTDLVWSPQLQDQDRRREKGLEFLAAFRC